VTKNGSVTKNVTNIFIEKQEMKPEKPVKMFNYCRNKVKARKSPSPNLPNFEGFRPFLL
jgi:hypothetical protein